MSLLYVLAFIGAYLDWQYVRHGGLRPTSDEKRNALIAIGLVLLTTTALFFMGGDAGSLGSLVGVMTIIVFFFWEFQRWRVRRKHPLGHV